jgi:hypothetical protein
VAAAVAAIALRPPTPPPDHGQLAATAPTTVRLGPDLEALAEPGAALTWTTVDGVARVAHTAGVVTYRQRGSRGLVVETPVAALTSERATFRVEAPMNRTVAVGAASAAIAAVVVIAVYEGRVSAKRHEPPDQPARPAQVVSAGEQVALAAPPPVTPPPVVAVAKAAIDRDRRAAVAAAIARARSQAQPATAAPRVGGAGDPTPAVVDTTPGELTKDEIRAGVKEVIPLLTECFEAELDRDPAVGRINATAHLTIDSAADIGTVVAMGDLEVDGALGKSPDFHDCLTATLEAMVLPPMGDGGHVDVTYPFVFAPTDDAAPTTTAAAPPPPPPAPRKPVPVRPLKPVPPSDPADLASDASNAAMNGEYARALAIAERALAMTPDAYLRRKLTHVAALSACKLRDVKRARRYYAQSSSGAQPGIRQTCLRDVGVDLAAE